MSPFARMKIASRISRMFRDGRLFPTALAMALVWVWPGAAQELRQLSLSNSVIQAGQSLTTNQAPAPPLSLGMNEILKMVDAGVSSPVIKTYIECSAIPYQPTGADVIVLKQHHAADEIVTLLLKRGARVRTAIAQARKDVLERALSARNAASGGLDPESYEYFQHYYLQPRALASAYERLAPYYNGGPYPYGYPPLNPGFPLNWPH